MTTRRRSARAAAPLAAVLALAATTATSSTASAVEPQDPTRATTETPQRYTVDPGAPQTRVADRGSDASGSTVSLTVSGLSPSADYRLYLADTDAVEGEKPEEPPVRFVDLDGDGYADLSREAQGEFGANFPRIPSEPGGAVPADFRWGITETADDAGRIEVVVDNTGSGSAVLVVWPDDAEKTGLDVDRGGAPEEPFGVSGRLTWTSPGPAEAPEYTSGVCAGSDRGQFSDVPASYYASAAIDCLADLGRFGLVNGYDDGTFRPDDIVDRATVAVFLGRVATSETYEAVFDDNTPPPFDDLGSVTPDQFHYISGLSLNGVVEGVTPAAYVPDRPVTRAQTASLVVRTHELIQQEALEDAPQPLPSVADDVYVDDDDSVHEDAIESLSAVGVLQGRGGTTFNPDGSLTRAQLALVLVRYLQLLDDTR